MWLERITLKRFAVKIPGGYHVAMKLRDIMENNIIKYQMKIEGENIFHIIMGLFL